MYCKFKSTCPCSLYVNTILIRYCIKYVLILYSIVFFTPIKMNCPILLCVCYCENPSQKGIKQDSEFITF